MKKGAKSPKAKNLLRKSAKTQKSSSAHSSHPPGSKPPLAPPGPPATSIHLPVSFSASPALSTRSKAFLSGGLVAGSTFVPALSSSSHSSSSSSSSSSVPSSKKVSTKKSSPVSSQKSSPSLSPSVSPTMGAMDYMPWQYKEGRRWMGSDEQTCRMLEKLYQANPGAKEVAATFFGRPYTVNFVDMYQTNLSTGFRRPLRRGEIEDLAPLKLERQTSLDDTEKKEFKLNQEYLSLYAEIVKSAESKEANFARGAEIYKIVFAQVQSDKSVKQPPAANVKVHQHSACQVCYVDFDKETPPAVMTLCRHASTCYSCLGQYLNLKIKEEDVMPWVTCPEETCRVHIHCGDLLKYLDTKDAAAFVLAHMSKTLSQSGMFTKCKQEGCKHGFLTPSNFKPATLTCDCGTAQLVERPKVDLGPEITKLIAEGKMRDCPKCGYYQMKDYGMCNVMGCGKCGIFWNWRTKETARTYNDLKEMSRMYGTMWEPGELAFQQRLESHDPKAFAALLAKNGIKYDPNFQRGAD